MSSTGSLFTGLKLTEQPPRRNRPATCQTTEQLHYTIKTFSIHLREIRIFSGQSGSSVIPHIHTVPTVL